MKGFRLPNFAPFGSKDQIAFPIDRDLFCSLEGKPDLRRTRSRRYDEVVLKLPLTSVIEQIYARIDSRVLDLRILPNVCPPLLRIIADEVVALERKLFGPFDPRCRARTHQPHPEDVRASPLTVFLQGTSICHQ